MTYSSGQLIESRDYNTFVWGTNDGTPSTSVNCLYRLWGPGYGDKGLGQDMSTVTAAFDIDPNTSGVQNIGELYSVANAAVTSITGDTVKAVQWTGMIAAINRMRFHQVGSGSNLSVAGVSIGSTVSVIAAISSSLSSASTAMGTGSVASVISGPNVTDTWVFNSTAVFRTTTFTRTITFPTGDAARYFFNAGGYIRLRLTSPTTAGSERTIAMAETINDTGTVDVKYSTNTGLSGTTTGGPFAAAGKGYWDMGTTYLKIGRHEGGAGTAPYADSYVEVFCKVSGTTGDQGDVGNEISFRVDLGSGFGGTGTESGPGGSPTWATDSMNLTINSTIDIFPPRTTVLINSWGTPTVS
jgi:hypothetical protein